MRGRAPLIWHTAAMQSHAHAAAATAPVPVHRYGGTARLFHWLMAVMIVVSFCVGVYVEGLPSGLQKLKVMNYHKWAGVTILLLAVLRLLWRLTHRPPPDVPMPAWQRSAAHAGHWLLYALMLAVPLVGWAYSSAAGYPIVWFGTVPLPDFVGKDRELAEAIKPWHGRLAWLLALVVIGHVAAALKHHFIDRDGLLNRMR